MVWQRARNPEQKEQRRQSLLDAAARLFERDGFDKASLNAIAKAANISKGNIYRYFESREALFLSILLEDYTDWIGSLVVELQALVGSNDAEAVAGAVVSSLATRPRLTSLIAVLTSVLEHNISVDVVVGFKQAMLELSMGLGMAVQGALPTLTLDDLRELLGAAHFLIAGMWPAAHPPPAVAEALTRPELAIACVDFERDLQSALTTLIHGLRARRRLPDDEP